MGRNVYIGPGVEGSVTASFRSVPVDGVPGCLLCHCQAHRVLATTMNGFYAVGSRTDILQLKNDIPGLDRKP